MYEDCFAHGDNGCSALTVAMCPKKCAFYKSRAQHDHDRQKALQRVFNLGTGNRVYISEKYYKVNLLQQ